MSELVCDKKGAVKGKGKVYKSIMRPAMILFGSDEEGKV